MFMYSVNLESFAVLFPVDTEASASAEHTLCPQKYDMCVSQLPYDLPLSLHSGVREA